MAASIQKAERRAQGEFMKRYLLGVLGAIVCASTQASTVKEELELGPLHVSVPRWSQGIDLQSISASSEYLSARDLPKPFSAIDIIEVHGRLSNNGVLYIAIRNSAACSRSVTMSSRDNAVHGRKCLVWEEGGYVVVDYYANFGSASLQRGKEFLTLVSVSINGAGSDRVYLYEE